MPGLIPEFTQADIDKKVNAFHEDKLRKMFEVLSYVGIRSVNYAKSHHGYKDQTGNLTSSIGYAVLDNGKVHDEKYQGTAAGIEQSKKVIDELAGQFSKGLVLVVVAGMEYAAAVESKGYDVITGSSFYADSELMPILKSKLGAAFS
jgi:hypothetical protein